MAQTENIQIHDAEGVTRARVLRIGFDSGETADFELLWDMAPAVCSLLVGRLPESGTAIHGIYSGTIVGVLLDPDLDAPLQNATTCHMPGDLIWMHYPPLSRFDHPDAVSEIYWAYDRHVRSVVPGRFVQIAASVFARADVGLAGWSAFAARSQEVRWEGATTVSMSVRIAGG
jgi:hypothetical protein